MNSPPHPVMHFGMTGWMHIKKDPASHYRQNSIETEWPPRFLKFNLTVEGNDNEFAFVDGRRLGRVRLIDVDGNHIRATEPIASNGPDPVQEQIEDSWLFSILGKRKVPVKAFLLDQAILSGIGNWVADEILFHSRIHPETYTNTLSEDQMAALFKSINYVTRVAVETEAEQDKFPEDWLMHHRWGKGKNNGGKLPSGQKIEFVKVGGRTSAYVPELQKKGVEDTREENGATEAKSIKRQSSKRKIKEKNTEETEEKNEELALIEEVPKRNPKKQVARSKDMKKPKAEDEEEVSKTQKQVARGKGRKRLKEEEVKEEGEEEEEEEEDRKPPVSKKRKAAKATAPDDGEFGLSAGPPVKRVRTRMSARLRK